MAVGNGEPGVEVSMAIPTTSALASTQSTDISNAVTTGALSTQWGKLGDFLSPSLLLPMSHIPSGLQAPVHAYTQCLCVLRSWLSVCQGVAFC